MVKLGSYKEIYVLKNKIIKQLNDQNLTQVLKEYEEIVTTYKLQNNAEYGQNKQGYMILKAIDNVISKNSREQFDHLEKTTKLALMFSEELNLNYKDKKSLVLLARYHDIGKININKNILSKPGKLNDEEWLAIKQHPIYSYQILSQFSGLQEVALGALSHHERFDGTGYPAKLAGNEISFLARIISVLDTYEVLTSGRVYRAPVSQKDALLEIRRCSGTQFDPQIVDAFEKFIIKTYGVELNQQQDSEISA